MATDKQIDIVIFDIGNVLASIVKEPLHQLLACKGLSASLFFDDDFQKFQCGIISQHDFFHAKSSILEVNPGILHHTFAAMLDVTTASTIVPSLKIPYLFMSNINEFHFEGFCQRVPYSLFASQFSVLSYRVGYLKPSASFFEKLDEEIVKHGATVLYLDDKEENLRQATRLGLRAELCPSPQHTRAVLKNYQLI